MTDLERLEELFASPSPVGSVSGAGVGVRELGVPFLDSRGG